MNYFSNLFTSLFRSSASRYKMRMGAQVKRATIGRVQAKAMKAQIKLDQAAYGASDKITGLNKQDNGSPKLQNNATGGRGAAGGRAAAGGAAGGGMPQASQVARKQQGSAKMGKGNKNIRQHAMAVTCMSCGSELQPDWDMCPYCGTPVGQVGAAPPQAMMGAPVAADNGGEKTVAINLSDISGKESRSVVGWIVAQNGNHRGEDFRIYDGKNILGTAADCDIVITDPYLSAKHCTIRHENGNFQVTDIDSMNGTFVNQKRCTKSDLIDNDTLRLGRTEFKFKSLF